MKTNLKPILASSLNILNVYNFQDFEPLGFNL